MEWAQPNYVYGIAAAPNDVDYDERRPHRPSFSNWIDAMAALAHLQPPTGLGYVVR